MTSAQSGFISTLSTRLSLALIAIIIAVGVGVLVTSQAGMRIHYEELNQKLNFSIAMYVTGEYELIQQDGTEPNREVLQ